MRNQAAPPSQQNEAATPLSKRCSVFSSFLVRELEGCAWRTDGLKGEREARCPPVAENLCDQDRVERVAGHPPEQDGAEPSQRAPDQGRCERRGARRGHRPARPVAVLGPLYPQPTGAGPARAALASYLRFRLRR